MTTDLSSSKRSSSSEGMSSDKPKFARNLQTPADFFEAMESTQKELEAGREKRRYESKLWEEERPMILSDLDALYKSKVENLPELVETVQSLIVPELRQREDEMSGYPYDVLNRAKNAPPEHHSVYVILLSRTILDKKYSFLPSKSVMPCVYVGMSWHSPEHRFDQHTGKEQRMQSRFTGEYALALLPEIYEPYNPMPQGLAKQAEKALAAALELIGCNVYGGY